MVQGPLKVQKLRRVDDPLRGTVAATSNTNVAVVCNLCNPKHQQLHGLYLE